MQLIQKQDPPKNLILEPLGLTSPNRQPRSKGYAPRIKELRLLFSNILREVGKLAHSSLIIIFR